MPKAPILDRESFYDVLPDGTIRDLDWNLVNTDLGAMVEPRIVLGVNTGGDIAQMDAKDVSINRRTRLDEDQFFRRTNHGGHQIPVDYNT